MSAGKGVSAMRESPMLEAALKVHAAELRFCLDCGLAICADRLAAVPRAVRCLDCQHRHEDAAGGLEFAEPDTVAGSPIVH